MKHLKHLLMQPLSAVPTKLVVAILVVALIGFADAAYLAVEHYSGVIPPCSVGGCELVLTSPYATVYGIPIALVGAIYYLLILIGAFAYLEGKYERLLRGALALTVVGFAVSLILFLIQAFVLEAFCLYCIGSAITSTTLFGLSAYIFSKHSSNE